MRKELPTEPTIEVVERKIQGGGASSGNFSRRVAEPRARALASIPGKDVHSTEHHLAGTQHSTQHHLAAQPDCCTGSNVNTFASYTRDQSLIVHSSSIS